MPFVIDANIAIAWFTASPAKLAEAALTALADDAAIVPAMWRWEVQDVLRRLSKDGTLHTSPADAIVELRQLPISIDDGISGLFGNEFVVANDYGLSVYDAAYLELATRLNIPLATIDKKLASAARQAGLAFQS
jgi:predicted nucleic acid-binding protein